MGSSPARERILTVAARLFMEQGCAATAVREIANGAGVSLSSLYHWIGSKDNLVYLLHERMVGELIARLREVADSGDSAADRVRGVMRVVLSVIETHHAEVIVFLREGHALPAELRDRITVERDRVDTIVDTVLREGIDSGEFRADLDVRLTRLAILGTGNWAYQWFRPGGGRSGREIADAFADILTRGLVAER